MRALPAALAIPLCIAAQGALASVAHAEDGVVGGSIAAQLVIADGDIGGGAMIDLWVPFGPLRIGGFLGANITPSERDNHNRIAMPAGALIGLTADLDGFYLSVLARGGLWAGSTQETKLTAGGLVGGAAFFDVHIGQGSTVGFGVDVWGILGTGETWAVVPSIRISWGQPFSNGTSE